jgi:membrane protease YdiL (CAAX protease family)
VVLRIRYSTLLPTSHFSCTFKERWLFSPNPVSAPHNPISEPAVPAEPQFQLTPVPTSPPPIEDPPWTGWDVVALAFITFFTVVACIFATAYLAHLRFSPSTPWLESLKRPEVVVGQLLAYVFVLIRMYKVVRNHSDSKVSESIRWNWPPNWTLYLLGGVTLAIFLLPLGNLLPMPKDVPIDEFFRTARDAYILSLFGILFAPLFEELLFRGFLYPVVARRFGLYPSIILTSLAFASIHASQLKYSWGPVLIIFLVGIVLTTVRALKKSVAATVLMHMAYNGTIFIATYIATDRFRHMERFNR